MGLTWKQSINDFSNYLKIEKSLSPNSVSAYTRDVKKLEKFCEERKNGLLPLDITHKDMEDFILWYGDNNDNARTQARMLSGIKGFYRFLVIEGETDKNPTLLIESPKIGFKLPQVLSLEEILALMNAIDLSTPEG
ncbi:MAG: site-specific integrase, partial [Bacteroidales bacterium]|nr:site-specific integrase [Bacteroidales bacterium]